IFRTGHQPYRSDRRFARQFPADVDRPHFSGFGQIGDVEGDAVAVFYPRDATVTDRDDLRAAATGDRLLLARLRVDGGDALRAGEHEGVAAVHGALRQDTRWRALVRADDLGSVGYPGAVVGGVGIDRIGLLHHRRGRVIAGQRVVRDHSAAA